MTTSEVEAILERLETLAPSSRLSEKRQILSGARERIIALRQRGHSWRSLATELSAAIGQKISPDLLRAACMKRAQRHNVRKTSAPASVAKVAAKKPLVDPTFTPVSPLVARFGAKGLKV